MRSFIVSTIRTVFGVGQDGSAFGNDERATQARPRHAMHGHLLAMACPLPALKRLAAAAPAETRYAQPTGWVHSGSPSRWQSLGRLALRTAKTG